MLALSYCRWSWIATWTSVSCISRYSDYHWNICKYNSACDMPPWKKHHPVFCCKTMFLLANNYSSFEKQLLVESHKQARKTWPWDSKWWLSPPSPNHPKILSYLSSHRAMCMQRNSIIKWKWYIKEQATQHVLTAVQQYKNDSLVAHIASISITAYSLIWCFLWLLSKKKISTSDL